MDYGLLDIPKTNLVWLLLDWKLQVIKRPKYADKIIAKTWARYANKLYTYRDFEVYNENNELVAIATSKWVLVDVSKGRITKIENEIFEKYTPELDKSVFNIVELEKLTEIEVEDSRKIYLPSRDDIDMNNHVHNLAYLKLAYEVLPDEIYENNNFNTVRINYKKEIKYGENILCKYIFENGKHIITIKDENDKVLHSIIELY